MSWVDQDESAEARFRALADLPADGSATQALLLGLNDDSWRVRRLAADRLAQRPTPEVVRRLVAVLGERGATSARNAAATALAQSGQQAVRPLIELLGHADPDQRKFAADILGELARPEAVPALVPALQDPDANVRAAAAEALGRVGGPEALRALERLLDSADPLLRVCGLEGLARLRGPPALPRLKPLLDDPLTRRSAYRLLGMVEHPTAWGLVCQGLKAPSTRDAALLAFGTRDEVLPADVEADVHLALLRSADVVPWLRAALASDEEEKRVGALLCAHALRAPELAAPVADSAAGDRLAQLSLEVLLRLGVEGARRLLAGSPPALTTLSRDARAVAGEALLRLAEPSLVGPLTALLAAGDTELAELAARALGRTRAVHALPVLMGLFADDALAVHAFRSVVTLAESWPQEVRAALGPVVERTLRPHGVRAWAHVAGPDALKVLRHALHHEDDAIRAAAAEVAPLVGGAGPELLGAALMDESVRVRRSATRALGRLAAVPQVGALLARLLEDSDASVRATACLAAAELGALGEARRLEALATGAEPLVALAALSALAQLGVLSDEVLAHACAHADGEVVKKAFALGADRAPVVAAASSSLVHAHWDVRVAAARVLAVSAPASAREALEAALVRETDHLAREMLQAALAQLKARTSP